LSGIKKLISVHAGEDECEECEDDASSEDPDKRKKKKREAKKSNENFPAKKSLKKKSIEWSKLFGIDRKKKSLMYNPFKYIKDERKRERIDSEEDYYYEGMQ
jgi:hypothetical protein